MTSSQITMMALISALCMGAGHAADEKQVNLLGSCASALARSYLLADMDRKGDGAITLKEVYAAGESNIEMSAAKDKIQALALSKKVKDPVLLVPGSRSVHPVIILNPELVDGVLIMGMGDGSTMVKNGASANAWWKGAQLIPQLLALRGEKIATGYDWMCVLPASERTDLSYGVQVPVSIDFRRAIMGSGMVASIKADMVPRLTATCKRPSTKESQAFTINSLPVEIGHKEGWVFQTGDQIWISTAAGPLNDQIGICP